MSEGNESYYGALEGAAMKKELESKVNSTERDIKILKERVDEIQRYLFGKPSPPAEDEIEERRRRG